MDSNKRPQSDLFFDPTDHPDNTLKAFNDFTRTFQLRYNAQFPDPPKVSLDAALTRWKYTNATAEQPDPKPTREQYDQVIANWRSKDKVAKFLGMFSSETFYEDWVAAQPDETERDNAEWNTFTDSMKEYYKPTENLTLRNFQFRDLIQGAKETFPVFCNRVEKEAKHCSFKCAHADCTADKTAIRDQILIGTNESKIREEALMKSWDLATLRKEGMRMESAAKGEAQIAGESVNKIGKYSYKNQNRNPTKQPPKGPITCYNCGKSVNTGIMKHVRQQCEAIGKKCEKCDKMGHLTQCCRNPKDIRRMEEVPEPEQHNLIKENDQEQTEEAYNINIFHVKTSKNTVLPRLKSTLSNDFRAPVIVNNNYSKPIADTGAKVSVCGTAQAKRWGILDRMVPSSVKLKPYNSAPIPVAGIARCSVTFGSTSIPVEWHVISGSCEPILDGTAAEKLGIIKFNRAPEVFHPIQMISDDAIGNEKEEVQSILQDYPEVFTGLGRLKNHQVKLHAKNNVIPVRDAPRPTPYHLEDRSRSALHEMLVQDVVEEHPVNEPSPWVSNVVLREKDDGGLRVTMDAKNVNKAIQSSNLPIPRQEDIKAKLAHKQYFSKLDFKSAFWQLELDPASRQFTVFQMFNKLYRYKVLTMGLKPAQGELNAALAPLFDHIKNLHLIHDDVIIATSTIEEHLTALHEIMEAISKAGLTLNPTKCTFLQKEIRFWGMIFGAFGVKPDPEKVDDLKYLTPPESKTDLISFLCMMQSNSEFIPQFAKKSAPLRELTKGNTRFKWEDQHQQCFQQLIAEFQKDTTLRYFDAQKEHSLSLILIKLGSG